MVEKIYKLKNEILQQAEKELEERGPERMDVDRLGEMIDMVKDLAEAEKSCWEAQYYRSVTEAMEDRSGYSMPQQSSRMGYGGGTGSSTPYVAARGHQDVIETLRSALQVADPNEREQLRKEVKKVAGLM